MNKIFWVIVLLVGLSACGGNAARETTTSAPKAKATATQAETQKEAPAASMASGEAIRINIHIPYKKGGRIARNIKRECKLNIQLSQFIDEYADSYGINVVRASNVKKSDAGKVLIVEITDAISSGNAFIGHRKSTNIVGTLYNNGKSMGSFEGLRVSGGGAFGGFKGSCSVLGRTVKALGKDVANWLKNPRDNAFLGDA